jgi:glycosyltransferase involved in cell wall biosynthesis
MKRKKKGVKRSLTIKNTRDGLKITACLILKNEGKTIYRCLDSIKDFVDEYVIGIDSTTEDNTVDEIKRFLKDNKLDAINRGGERKDLLICQPVKDGVPFDCGTLYKYKWQNDFSKARNEGMDKSTGDYILIMDGHEYFPEEWFNITEQKMIKVKEALYMGGNNVRKILIEQRPDEAYFQLYQQPFIGTTPNNFFLQPRIYRNAPEIKFNRTAHNTIKNTKPENQIHFPEVILIHDAPEDNRAQRKAQRVKMNTEELLKKLKETPQDTRAMFYLGNTYMEAKKWKKALRSFEHYLKTRKDESSEKYQVLIHKALCLKELEKWIDMRNCIQIAKGMNPFRRDAHLLLADMYIHLKKWDNAIYELTAGLRLNPKASRMFQNGAGLTWDPHQKLAMCYEKTGQIPRIISKRILILLLLFDMIIALSGGLIIFGVSGRRRTLIYAVRIFLKRRLLDYMDMKRMWVVMKP